MKNPWLRGQYEGRDTQIVDVASRLHAIKNMNADELKSAIQWPETQKTVRQAAERRLRKVDNAKVTGSPKASPG